nr:immunoglobulin light chain junction region [Macaca mulatta]MOX24999.1 immunoglobulin light chain junction region [Macaca mulatta]MOX26090.1 immunoglobulin light chain junction region [Macaca mulatta]
CQQGFSPPFTF